MTKKLVVDDSGEVIEERVVPSPARARAAAPEPEHLTVYGGAEPLMVITLQGGGNGDGQYRVGQPIPQAVAVSGSTYDLSDRAAGLYNWRVK
jgi:hypothetical protein